MFGVGNLVRIKKGSDFWSSDGEGIFIITEVTDTLVTAELLEDDTKARTGIKLTVSVNVAGKIFEELTEDDANFVVMTKESLDMLLELVETISRISVLLEKTAKSFLDVLKSRNTLELLCYDVGEDDEEEE